MRYLRGKREETMLYDSILEQGQKLKSDTQKFFKNNKLKGKKLDELFHAEHEKVFKKIDCLSCANCAKQRALFLEMSISKELQKV